MGIPRRIFKRQKNKPKDHDSVIDTEINKLNRSAKTGQYQDVVDDIRRKDDYTQIITQLDRLQNVALFEYEIEGEDFTSWEIPNALYKWTSLMFFKDKTGKLVYTPYTATNWMYNNMPLTVQPVPQRDGQHIEIKDYFVGIDCVLLYWQAPLFESDKGIPHRITAATIIEQMADIFVRLNANMILSSDRLVIEVENEENADEIMTFYKKAYSASFPVIITPRNLETAPLEQSFSVKFQELTALLKEFDQFRMLISGFGSGSYGIHKKERLITDEANQNSDSPQLIYEHKKRCLQDFKKQMAKVFNITVTIKEVEDVRRRDNRDAESNESSRRENSKVGE